MTLHGFSSQVLACTVCPAGHFCNDAAAPPEVCATGSFMSSEGATACDPCPAGQECLNPSEAPIDCDDGYYSPSGDSTCYVCSAGFSCSASAESGCGSGEYSLALEVNCTECPPGYMCPHSDLSPIPCPEGYHTGGAGRSTQCIQCVAGEACPDPS